MRDRLKKINRVLKVQGDLHRLAEWKLAGLARESAALDDAQKSLIGALNEHDAFHGLFIDTMARRLRTLAGEAERVETAQTLQANRVVEEAMRMKRTERRAVQLGREHRQSEEKRRFSDLLESMVAGDDASLR